MPSNGTGAVADRAGEWISFSAAARRLGTHSHAVKKMARAGRLTVLRLPGCWPRVLASDVERLAREAVEPAAAG